MINADYHRKENRRRTKMWIVLILLTLGAVALSGWLIGPPPPKKIKMATGQEGGAYDDFGKEYRSRLEKMGLGVELVNTNGSIDNLQRLVNHQADVAFAQGGTYQFIDDPQAILRSLAAIYLEPMWVFYRADKAAHTVSAFKGQRISVGLIRSGTEAVGRLLLETHGIDSSNSRIVNLVAAEARARLMAGTLDVAIFVASCQDHGIHELLAQNNLRLMNFQRHDIAHSRQFPYLKSVRMSEGLIDLKDNLPREEVTLLAPTAMLVCREDLQPQVIEQVLKVAQGVHAAGSIIDPPSQFPALEGGDMPIHESAETYMRSGESLLSRLLPYWGQRFVLRARILILPLLVIWLPFLKFLPVIYNYRFNSLLKRHYAVLRDAETSIAQATNADDLRDRLEILENLRDTMESLSRKVPATFQRDIYHWRLHVSLVRSEAADRLRRMQESAERQEQGNGAVESIIEK